MKTYLLQKEITLSAPIEKVWHFFSNPRNLQKITPAYMKFRITACPDTAEIYNGMLIEYTVSPLLHIPMKWITLIQAVERMKSFTDHQLSGPYRLWEHTHTFHQVPSGTLMQDEIKYALPMGPLGVMAHRLFVRKQLEAIFKYRETVIPDYFNLA